VTGQVLLNQLWCPYSHMVQTQNMWRGKKLANVEYECRSDSIAIITLNRPERLNAFNGEMLADLITVLDEFDRDDSASVAVINGAGKSFCAGADVKALAELGELPGGKHSQDLLYQCKNWKPVVAAVHGYVLGMSIELTFQSEIVIAARSTRFQVTETLRGVSTGPIWPILQYRAGVTFANSASLTGRFFDAEEAKAYHLVNEVTEDGDHLSVAIEHARVLAELPQASVRQVVRVARWYMEQHQRQSVPFFEQTRHLTSTAAFEEFKN